MTPNSTYNLHYCVWELTLACDARCVHCGSRAGNARVRELNTKEALTLIGDLDALGCKSITLSGGEPLMRDDWPVLATAIKSYDIQLEIITNGLNIEPQLERILEADFYALTVSIDGPADIHDKLRGIRGGLAQALKGIDALKKAGIRVGAVTQINRVNFDSLPQIADLLIEHKVDGWQLQLTMPHGRASDRANQICLSPKEMSDLEHRILELKQTFDLHISVGDNIGYFGPNEPKIRTPKGENPCIWPGCEAGLSVVGITSDGNVRGCLSLPSTYDEGNVKERSLVEIWQDPNLFAYNRQFSAQDLEGACGKCPLGKICRAGCTSQAVAITGSPLSNPMCTRALAEGWEA